jgi:phosphate:Na+ symporter
VEITREMFEITRVYTAAQVHDKKLFERINHLEDITDNIEEEMINFITSLLTSPVTQGQSIRSYTLIRMADELESIADSLQSLSIYRSRLFKRKEDFSAEAWRDILSFYDDVTRFFDNVMDARRKRVGIVRVEVLLSDSRKLNKVAKRLRDQHMERLKSGTCLSIPAQTYSDMFVTIKHIKNHTLNFLQTYAGIP